MNKQAMDVLEILHQNLPDLPATFHAMDLPQLGGTGTQGVELLIQTAYIMWQTISQKETYFHLLQVTKSEKGYNREIVGTILMENTTWVDYMEEPQRKLLKDQLEEFLKMMIFHTLESTAAETAKMPETVRKGQD